MHISLKYETFYLFSSRTLLEKLHQLAARLRRQFLPVEILLQYPAPQVALLEGAQRLKRHRTPREQVQVGPVRDHREPTGAVEAFAL